MRTYLTLIIAAACLAGNAQAKQMKARVIQQPYEQTEEATIRSFQWTLDELEKCDQSLDIIVLPEFSEVPGKTSDFLAFSEKNGPILLKKCIETARRCNSLVFCGAVDRTEFGPRNTIFCYNRKGELVGKYLKEQLTRGEWARTGLDKSYTEKWNAPYMIEIEGLRFAFLTCYDFYFYENYSNIARYDPDIIIGCSHQRSDLHSALDMIDSFCAYNTGAYLVRSSVSMGLDSKVGGCSCIVAPTGRILANIYSGVGSVDATFDPTEKYLKPAGYGNPPAKHCQYVDIGRRPWKYRPCGSAIVTPIEEAPSKRICTTRGFASISGTNLLAAYGAAVAAGATEIGIRIDCREDIDVLRTVMSKLSCHTIMNLMVEKVTEGELQQILSMVFDYDAVGHTYITSSNAGIMAAVRKINPRIQRCLVISSTRLDEFGKDEYQMVQCSAKAFTSAFADIAHSGQTRCCVVCASAEEAVKALGCGADTVIVEDYPSSAEATGIK